MLKKPELEKLVFENGSYTMWEIPLNYQIRVKLKKPDGTRLIWSDFYSPLDRGLDYAKKMAEYMINKYRK